MRQSAPEALSDAAKSCLSAITPHTLTVWELRDVIVNTPSIARADIVEIRECVERFGGNGALKHRFVVLRLQLENQPSDRWLRLERHRRYFAPYLVPPALRRLLMPSFRFSEDEARTINLNSCCFPAFTHLHVVILGAFLQ